MKNTYGFDSKNLAREKLKDFVGKHYSAQERKDLQVLTLLGHETYEIDQIWDPLGVPRENITVIESNNKPYEIIKKLDLGINLEPKQTIKTYIQNTEKTFDVMNLDYQGYFNTEKVRTISDISYNCLLGERGILALWYQGRRENEETKNVNEIFRFESAKDLSRQAMEILKDPNANIENTILGYLIEKRTNSLKQKCIRDEVDELIIGHMIKGISNYERNPLVDKLGIFDQYIELLKKDKEIQKQGQYFLNVLSGQQKMLCDDLIKENYECYLRLKDKIKNKKTITSDEWDEYFMPFHGSTGISIIRKELKNKIRNELKKLPNKINKNMTTLLSDNIIKKENEGYFIEDGEKLLYRNDKGTPMLVQIGLFSQLNNIPISYRIKNKRINLEKNIFSNPIKTISKLISFNEKMYSSNLEYLKREIQELIPQTKPEIQEIKIKDLTKNDVYDLLKQGKTKEQIIEIDPNQNPRTISTYKAHITMDEKGIQKGRPKKNLEETINEQKNPEIQEIKIEQKNLETNKGLTKKEAIEYLKAGFTPKEIIQEYPKFSIHQLGAWKAWYVTMNKESA